MQQLQCQPFPTHLSLWNLCTWCCAAAALVWPASVCASQLCLPQEFRPCQGPHDSGAAKPKHPRPHPITATLGSTPNTPHCSITTEDKDNNNTRHLVTLDYGSRGDSNTGAGAIPQPARDWRGVGGCLQPAWLLLCTGFSGQPPSPPA